MPGLQRTWAEEVKAFGTVLGDASPPPCAADCDEDFGDGADEALEGDAEGTGEAGGPLFRAESPFRKSGGEQTGDSPFSQCVIRGVLSPGSSSLSTVDWRLGALATDSKATADVGC